jgi:hypothetical protein
MGRSKLLPANSDLCGSQVSGCVAAFQIMLGGAESTQGGAKTKQEPSYGNAKKKADYACTKET